MGLSSCLLSGRNGMWKYCAPTQVTELASSSKLTFFKEKVAKQLWFFASFNVTNRKRIVTLLTFLNMIRPTSLKFLQKRVI
jgi:hypothetical protein